MICFYEKDFFLGLGLLQSCDWSSQLLTVNVVSVPTKAASRDTVNKQVLVFISRVCVRLETVSVVTVNALTVNIYRFIWDFFYETLQYDVHCSF